MTHILLSYFLSSEFSRSNYVSFRTHMLLHAGHVLIMHAALASTHTHAGHVMLELIHMLVM